MTNARTNWKNELRRTDDCLFIERLGEELTEGEREHLETCVRCQAEMALWKEFRDSETRPEETNDVKWIRDRLEPGEITLRSNVVRWNFNPRILAIAATLVIVIAVGYVVQTREPSVHVPLTGTNAYRSTRLDLAAPLGDLTAAPAELRWAAFSGADRYDVEILEVDRTLIWRSTATEARIDLPAAVSAQFVPGKTILWQVTARRGQAILAESGLQRCRVKPK